MKITKEDLANVETASPLELFEQGIRAKETKTKYTNTLRRILCEVLEEVLEGTFEQRATRLVREGKKNPIWVRNVILQISKKQRERTALPRDHPDYFNPSSMRNFFKPIKKLLDMNDVNLSWKRIYATFPEIDNVTESHGWSKDEIRTMLRFCEGTIERAIILVSASSSIRVGGFEIKWEHIRPIYHSDKGLSFDKGSEIACATISVYHGTSSAYPAFITPEAYTALQDYARVWEDEAGRAPALDDPVFKQSGPAVVGADSPSLKRRIDKIARKAGLRTDDRRRERRFDVHIMNGFRGFWNKTCKEAASNDSPLASLIKKEYMMGHAGLVSLDRNYFKTRVLELAEEYVLVAPALTMDESEELRQINRAQSELISRLQTERDTRIEELERIMGAIIDKYQTEGHPKIRLLKQGMQDRLSLTMPGRDGPSQN